LSSLNILNGISPGHIHHPGTTLQLLGALVIFVTAQFDFSGLGITEKVLNDPERYLLAIRYVLNSLILVTWILLSHALVHRTRKTWLLLPFNGGLLATTAIYVSMQRMSPEPLLVSITLLLGYFLIELYFNGTLKRTLPMLMGITLAAGIITKVTFAPMLLLILVFDKRRDMLIALVSLLLASMLLIIPIWDEIPRMARWFVNLATHTGRYGTGEKGLVSIQALYDNFNAIKSTLYFLLLTLAAILVFVSVPRASAGKKKFYLLALSVLVAQIFITLKHPGERYLVPAQVYGALVFALLINGISRIKPLIAAGVLPFLIWFWYVSAKDFGKNIEQRIASRKSYAVILQKAQDLECKIIHYYRTSSISYALNFGNGFARYQYADKLSRLYPDFVSYEYWLRRFEYYYQGLPSHESVSQLRKPGTLCFIGVLNLNKKIPLAERVHVEGNYRLFTLDSRTLQ